MKRSATANWKGSGKERQRELLPHKAGFFQIRLYHTIQDLRSVKGTSPEELVAAAHAGCFSMKLSFVLNAAGFSLPIILIQNAPSLWKTALLLRVILK